MKKIIFSTCILALSAGAAAAEISFKGFGRVGVVHQEDRNNSTYMFQKFRLDIKASTEIDSGWTVSGITRIQTDESPAKDNTAFGAGPSAAKFQGDYGGFRFEAGFIDDVLVSNEIINIIGTSLGISAWADQRANFVRIVDNWGMNRAYVVGREDTPQGFRMRQHYDNGVSIAASYTPDHGNVGIDENPGEYYQVGARYKKNGHNIGLVYGDNKAFGDYWVLGADGRFNDFGYSFIVIESERAYKTAYGATATYQLSEATLLQAVFTSAPNGKEGLLADAEDMYGVGVIHDLGGGTSVRASFGKDKFFGTTADLGLWFFF